MLHTLNKAWTNILTKQAQVGLISNALFVVKDMDEFYKVHGWILQRLNKYDHTCQIILEKDVYGYIIDSPYEFPIYDDILISHDINNPLIKSYLSKHCRRKGT